jgi:hypothetical protein
LKAFRVSLAIFDYVDARVFDQHIGIMFGSPLSGLAS